MKYTSLFEYLDEHLPKNASREQVLACKRDYYKLYRREHRKLRVQNAKALSLTIPKELWNELKTSANELGIGTYDYIKTILGSTPEANLEIQYQFSRDLYVCFELLKQYIDGDITIDHVYAAMEQLILKL